MGPQHKIAKEYLFTAWSPDSRLLIKVEQRAGFASAELCSFTQIDVAAGPLELVKLIEPAVRKKMQGGNDGTNYALTFTSQPAMTINDQGLLRAAVYASAQDASRGPTYEVTLQVTRTSDSIDADVVSVTPYAGTSISIIVH